MSAASTAHQDIHSDVDPVAMSSEDALSNEVLRHHVFAKLPHFDLLRARAVCKRWKAVVAESLDTFEYSHQDGISPKSYCPLIFKRNDFHHLWWGYDCATGSWEPFPPLTNLPQVDIRPLAGNGKRLMGFRITSVPSQVVVGNPLTSEWQTIPRSTETWGEVGNVLVVDSSDDGIDSITGVSTFRIIAVREDATEIFHSKAEVWDKLRQAPPRGLQEVTVASIRDKLISGTLSGGLLYCYGVDALVTFDVAMEKWTEDHIRLPHHGLSKRFQTLDCGGNLFAAIEDTTNCTISIWGLGLRRRDQFFHTVDMPSQFYSLLCRSKNSKPGVKQAQIPQLKAVGHKHRMYFWRNLISSTVIVEFDFLRRRWTQLPQFDQSDPDFQTFIDTGSFEP